MRNIGSAPHWTTILIIGTVIATAAACATVPLKPLPFPHAPAIKLSRCDLDMICMSEPDAQRVLRWMDELEAYRQAQEAR